MHRMTDQRGFASVTALVVMMVMLAVAAAVFSSSVQLSNSSNTDDAAQRAYQAAVAGVNTAADRIDQLKPNTTSCITTVVAAPAPAGGGWCAETAQESLGRKQAFSYRVSTSPPPSGTCAGDPLDTGSGDRCIVAVGVVNGVKRTVSARLGIAGSLTPFANNTSVLGYKDVRLKANAKVNSNLGVNQRLTVDRNGAITGSVYLGPKGKVMYKSNLPGPQINKVTEFFPAPVSFFNPPTSTDPQNDTAVYNDNVRSFGALPSSVGTYTNDANGRVLTINDGQSVTLSGSDLDPATGRTKVDPATGFPIPAYYNLCKLTLGKGAKINIAPGAWVRLYIDSKDRQGSRCTDVGTLAAGKDSSFSNPNKDPRSLQIFAWSKRSKLTIPNKQDLYAMIYAPFSKVTFSNKGKLYGGVAGQKVEIRKDMQVFSVPALSTYNVAALNVPKITAWKQCQAYQPISGASPAASC